MVPIQRSLIALALLGAAPAWSAPVGTVDPAPDQAAPAGLAAGTIDTAPAAVPGNSRTVDLLIQMQPRTPGAEFNERARAVARPIDAGAKPVLPAGLTEHPSGLFGAGANPAAARGVDTSVTPARPSISGASETAPRRPAPAMVDDGKIALPAALVRWVREHREQVVVGSVVLLALVWGGSIVLSNRRRRR